MKKRAIASLLVALSPVAALAGGPPPPDPCVQAGTPTQWAGNGHYYLFTCAPVSWNLAFAGASASTHLGLNGYLATVTSAEENAFISGLTDLFAWLGGSDAVDEGVFAWRNGPEDGQIFSYTNWQGGEPNDFQNEDHVVTNWFGSGRWNDIAAGSNFGYIIEYGSSTVPEPASCALMLTGLVGIGAAARARRRFGGQS